MSALLVPVRVLTYLTTIVVVVLVIARAELVDYSAYQHEYIRHFGYFKYRFLTTWNFILLAAYALLALICEHLLLKSAQQKVPHLRRLLQFRDAVFTSMVMPVSLLVTSVFWTLFWIDRELIFPEFMDQVLPPFDNHMVHTAIVPVVILETLLQPRKPPRSHLPNVVLMTVFFVAYGIPFLGTYYVYGKFLYPFVELLSPVSFVLFCAALWTYTLGLYRAQWPLVSWRWGSGQLKVQ